MNATNTINRGEALNHTPDLYPYQERDLDILFGKLSTGARCRLLYQLPTGGGKTRVFSGIAKRFIEGSGKAVVVLTHRVELCRQTSSMLKKLGIANKIIDSGTRRLTARTVRSCYVAMVETLKNRIKDGVFDPASIGLVIIDEAHHNSFRKLLGRFPHAHIIGVTATPYSSDVSLPMKHNYDELVTGESIADLIDGGFLARPVCWRYDVELNSLKTGQHGDFTISSSDALYASPAMTELLLHACETHARNKKTLIFNNGIFTSKQVLQVFSDAGYPIKHLDNHTPAAERADILKWFRKTKGAILTSVSILTTGFDEPSVQAVVLNRATTSLTLYHQMIGRGARRLPHKKTFIIVDLGNNTERFGAWQAPIDWQSVFTHPEAFAESLAAPVAADVHPIPAGLREKFPHTLQLGFDVQQAYRDAMEHNRKGRVVIQQSIRQHVAMCMENSNSVMEALALAAELGKEIEWRVKQYGKCVGKVTGNYLEWLREDYKSKLAKILTRLMQRRTANTPAALSA